MNEIHTGVTSGMLILKLVSNEILIRIKRGQVLLFELLLYSVNSPNVTTMVVTDI